ncbi:flagellar basal body L-ring protein [Solemya pervernicosa gill symbiont]|uniref:Flagellar L-ring protein n=1 Tax=Solemya pervernicosa gill symbiont TaxID=642797 RepID=A0A1T2L8Y9_9GAMM|nr:flagellar basal body L-ring protein FlgH [Solemya pervernicosa gill symbiont]OOZ41502.1 flagellar basal body L-ring protein [Solemya pervernicosa gill symbiont]
MNKLLSRSSIAIITAALLQGCISNPPQRGEQAYTPTIPRTPMQVPQNTGSIYQAGNEIILFEDRKARRVGDIITVVLSETTSAKKSSNVSTTKDNSVEISAPTVFGSVLEMKPKSLIKGLDANLTSAQGFDGSGGADQSNSLSGTITVTVSEVMPNGNLRISGEKWMQLNQGEEFIRITGLVRADDLKSDNTILSTQVADAQITYSGKGFVAASNEMGWMARFFNSGVWPF